ncbi:OsmC family protein [Polaromonas glacialis]|uniref:OsmC family protein n=1 Tax=Polaromonas glacialis TaxID=866564 RepID=UPI0004980F53|nr:OsmC family protein [Polaromonas glacialis]
MSALRDYLKEKAAILQDRKTKIVGGELGTKQLNAQVSVEGRSGIRRVRIRDFQIVTDAPKDFAGYNLGPSAPELLLGSLGSCLVHTLMIQAAWLDIAIDAAEVIVTGDFSGRTGHPAFPEFSAGIPNIRYRLQVDSTGTDDQLTKLHKAVEQFCPILNVLHQPQPIQGNVERVSAT